MQNFITKKKNAGIRYSCSLLLITLMVFLQAISSCKKTTISENEAPTTDLRPLQLPHGNTTGDIITAVMGNEGGTIKSKDGTLSIEVPPGAIDATTTFSIQEVENVLKSKGRSYRLLPEGLNFKKHVTLTYYYGDIAMEGINPDFLFLAYQDKNGYFYSANQTKGDRQKQTLTVTTTHFSDWTFYAQYDFYFPNDKLVNGELRLIEGEEAIIELRAMPVDKWDVEYAQIQLPDISYGEVLQRAVWDYSPKIGTMNSNTNPASVSYKAPAKVNSIQTVYINVTINGNLGNDNLGNVVKQMQIRLPVVISPDGYFILTENGNESAATSFNGEYIPLAGSQLTAGFSNGYLLNCYVYGDTGGFPYNMHGTPGGATIELVQNGKDGMIVFRPESCSEGNSLIFSPGEFTMKSVAQQKGQYFEGEFSVTMYGYEYCESGRTKTLSGKFRFRKNN